MQTPRLYWLLTILMLVALTVSCGAVPAPARNETQTPHNPAPVSQADSSSTATPALQPTATPQPAAPAQKSPRGTKAPKGGQNQGGDASQNLSFDIPDHPIDIILGRPTANSITISLLSAADQALSIAYGTESGIYTAQTEPLTLQANTPREITLANLTPDTQYFYLLNGVENTFHTARASGSTFTFDIQADSHLDSNTSPQVYEQTIANEHTDKPDFLIDLGDTFMTEKYKPYTDAQPQYLAQRYFLGQVNQTTPLFLVLGNHDGEGAPRGNSGSEISAWAAGMRTKYFPNPLPDSFYSGNTTPEKTVGALQDYYAWEWGEALFIVLDPYWFTPAQRGNTSDLWNPTLGEAQYRWLKTTLETSHAKWKFVFIHQLIGGADKDGRGGVEVAGFYEWGGKNADGSWGFDQYRPGWGTPIHQLLVANHVTAVFHGHDHLFVKQELDGIIYQEVPQPGNARPGNTDSAAQYGYISGDILGGPGHLRVTVAPDKITVDFIQASLSAGQNGQVANSYTIAPR